MLTSKQRAALRKEANGLTPVFQVGKDGIDQALVKATADCLAARELIKLRVLETSPNGPRDVAGQLAEATGAEVVQVIGSVLVLFLKKKKDSAFAAALK
ncbi:MAG: YhbY family RNA-binding protein [Oscillospiraceae bacterium]